MQSTLDEVQSVLRRRTHHHAIDATTATFPTSKKVAKTTAFSQR